MSRRHPAAVLAAVVVVAVAVGVAAVAVERRIDQRGAHGGRRTEVVEVLGPRGRILDRSGKVLVEDGTALQVRADLRRIAALPADERSALVGALAFLLIADLSARFPPGSGVATGVRLTPEVVSDRLGGDGEVAVVATGVGEAVREAIDASPAIFPGITVEPIAARRYPYGALAAHLLGYLGRISESGLQELDDGSLTEDSIVGRAGIERSHELELRGRPGRIVYELDENGRRVRELVGEREEPEPGRDVYLTIDIDLQHLAEVGLAAEVERRRGVLDGGGCYVAPGCDPKGAASVAVDPRDGQVLALASYPSYDPMLFADGISVEDYDAIAAEDRTDEHDDPLINRAIGGQYAPGATIKPFTAHAGLAAGLLTPDEPYDDTGIYRYSADCPIDDQDTNCSATNAGRTPHGMVTLADALRVSSDTYFYWLGDRSWRQRDALGEEVIQQGLVEWGFGKDAPIDVPGAAPGRVPTPDWLRRFAAELNPDDPAVAEEAGTWTPGVSGNLAVGQGDVLASPIQLAQAYATLANGGTRWRPQIVLQTTAYAAADDTEVGEPEEVGTVELPDAWRDPMIEGLDGVTKGPGGTATRSFEGFDQSACPVMGKTGTAQVNDRNDTSLFAAVAPTPAADRPSVISIATVVQDAGFGADAAVPQVRRVLEAFVAEGCDIDAFGETDGGYAAPLGGRIDVAEAIASFVPPGGDTAD